MLYIYKITNNINNKIYIGYTSKTPEQRFRQHINCSNHKKHSHLKLYRAFHKYGIDNFTISTLAEYTELKECLLAEDRFITEYNSTTDSIGYNMCPGGKGGNIKSQSQLEELSKQFTVDNPIHKIKANSEKYEKWKLKVKEGTNLGIKKRNHKLFLTFKDKLELIYPESYPIDVKSFILNSYKDSLVNRYLRYKPRYKDFYITPKGIFTSTCIAAKYVSLHPSTILRYCKNPDKYNMSNYGYFRLDINLMKPFVECEFPFDIKNHILYQL